MNNFESLGLSKDILKAIEEKGYITPSPIQAWVIPIALDTKKDVVWQAQTWSGKTAAFWLPILDKVNISLNKTQALILTPTRELAIQIAQELKSFSKYKEVSISLLYWGQSIRNEMSELRNNPKIIVWTPGRVTDHLQKWRLKLDEIEYFVLDEADEMLNVWFREEIEEILKFAPIEKRVFLFSATMPPFIANIVKNYMRDYETIAIKKEELTNSNITQIYFDAPRWYKFEVLCRILDITPDFYWIIFCRTKAETDEISAKLSSKWYLAEAIHWDIEQNMREKVLWRFKSRSVSILVATDVAARWIDVQDLSHVVNFDLPDNPESYTHRIWRTWRAWKTWTAISIVSNADSRKLFFIERHIKAKIKKEIIPTWEEVVNYKIKWLETDIENIISSWEVDYLDIAKKILWVHNPEVIVWAMLKKFYKDDFKKESYREFMSKDSRDFNSRWERGERSERGFVKRDDWMIRVFVAKWKMDNFSNPWMLLSFIANESWLWDLGAWKVDILTNFSYVDLPEDIWRVVLKVFKEKNPVKPLVVRAKEKRDDGGWFSRPRNFDRRDDRRDSFRWWRRDNRNSSRRSDFRK